MLQKVVLTIDADENSMATEVAWSILALDAVNFLSCLEQCFCRHNSKLFFHSLTLAVPTEPFLGFPSDEVLLHLHRKHTHNMLIVMMALK